MSNKDRFSSDNGMRVDRSRSSSLSLGIDNNSWIICQRAKEHLGLQQTKEKNLKDIR